jgi:hypothetical protein
VSHIMVMVVVQQQSKQNSRDADRTAREAILLFASTFKRLMKSFLVWLIRMVRARRLSRLDDTLGERKDGRRQEWKWWAVPQFPQPHQLTYRKNYLRPKNDNSSTLDRGYFCPSVLKE